MAFRGYLKQSTAVTIMLGPFVDEDDGKTAETGLTIAQADVRLSKNGGNMAQKNESTSCTHDEIGKYSCPLDVTDTNTLGLLTVSVHESGALPVDDTYQVVTANWWDTMCSTDQLDVNVTNVAGTAQTANDNGADINAILADTNEIQTDWVNGGRLDLILDELTAQGDTNEGKLDTIITDTNELQTDWTNGGRLDLILDAILADTNELQTDDIPGTLATIAGYIDTEVAAILADTNELQTDWANGGRLDLLIDAIKAVTDNLPDSGALTTLGGKIDTIDTVVDAIKVITDALTAAAAAKLAISAGTILTGTVSHDNTPATTTVFYSDDITEATADHFNGRKVIFTSGALQYQGTAITDYELDTGEGKFTVTALTEAPADNVTFIIV